MTLPLRLASFPNLLLVTWYLIHCVDVKCAITSLDIERFSLERRAKVLPMRWEPLYDFCENLGRAKHTNGPAVAVRSETNGHLTLPFISQHPSLDPNEPLSRLEFPNLAVPAVQPDEKVILHFFTALSPAANMEQTPGADGVGFRLLINDETVFEHKIQKTAIEEWALDLSPYTGKEVKVSFVTDPLGNSHADWALWGRPRALIEGRKARLKEGPKSRWLAVESLRNSSAPDRCVRTTAGVQGYSAVLVMDEHLDLSASLWEASQHIGKPLVPFAPPLVVGEGSDPNNHTLVRILNHWGTTEYQFLAYPPEVTGGVQVHAMSIVNSSGTIETIVLTAPLNDEIVDEVRLFSIHATNLGVFRLNRVPPPFLLTVGNFLSEHPGDEIALTSSNRPFDKILVLSYQGEHLDEIVFPSPIEGERYLSTKKGDDRDQIILLNRPDGKVFLLTAGKQQFSEILLHQPPLGNIISDSCFPDHQFWISGQKSRLAEVQVIHEDNQIQRLNIGERENRFYYQWYSAEEMERRRQGNTGRQHIKASTFEHLRMDLASTGFGKPDFERTDSEYWTGEGFRAKVNAHCERYNTSLPAMWEPCFTHRQPGSSFDIWMDQKDPDSGLPLYSMLNRNNKTVGYSEFGTSHFQMSTYAYGHSALDCLYLYPLREFLRNLAVSYRANPEHIVGVEPNHEHEIAVESEGTIGDYNLAMIHGFAEYLQRIYGDQIDEINQRLGTGFVDFFDAPRNWERGDWDQYSDSNPYFQNWIRYNRYIVNRRIAMTLREGLLAGFPPELLKTHQIPDTYAIGNLGAFSDVVARLTPIDYLLNAGTGYGITHYGLWYNHEHNAIQGANSSGFDQVSLGEYQALVPEAQDAWSQLKYMFDHGVYSVHCMMWPKEHDKGFNASMETALAKLLEEDAPRPGMTEGVGLVRSYRSGGREFLVAALGIGPKATGLLKSVHADGTAEGSVYVVPFHSHVNIDTVAEKGDLYVKRQPVTFGPYENLDSGEQFEICFQASGDGCSLICEIQGENGMLAGLSLRVPIQKATTSNRILFRNQIPVDNLSFSFRASDESRGVKIANLRIFRQTEQTTKLSKGIFSGKRHQGGVTFDILPDDCGL